MEYSHHLTNFLFSIINDVKYIVIPTCLTMTALYFPLFLLSIFNHSKLSKWILTIPTVIYLLLVPTYQPVRGSSIFNTFIAIIGIYYAQKVCEWILFRRKEFNQWSFLDIQHELFYYRVYTQPISVKKFKDHKKEIFFTGPIQYDKHLKSLIYILYNIIKYYLLLDFVIHITTDVISTSFYEKYYKKYLLVRIIINPLSACMVFLFFMISFEIIRYVFCLLLNRPLEIMPDLFRQPYRAISPIDFWSRWHQLYKSTWIELIVKPVSKLTLCQWPNAPNFVIHGISTMCVFFFSGVMHEYLVYITFKTFSGDQMKFFLLQGLAVLIEYALKHQFHQIKIPRSIGFLLTFVFNDITAGYFIKPWLPYFDGKQKQKYSFIDFIMCYFF